MFNEVWQQFTKLTSPISSAGDADVALGRLAGDSGEFETPQAAVTRVLVTGATGRSPLPFHITLTIVTGTVALHVQIERL